MNQFEQQREMVRLLSSDRVRKGQKIVFNENMQPMSAITEKEKESQLRVIQAREDSAKAGIKEGHKKEVLSQGIQASENFIKVTQDLLEKQDLGKSGKSKVLSLQGEVTSFMDRMGKGKVSEKEVGTFLKGLSEKSRGLLPEDSEAGKKLREDLKYIGSSNPLQERANGLLSEISANTAKMAGGKSETNPQGTENAQVVSNVASSVVDKYKDKLSPNSSITDFTEKSMKTEQEDRQRIENKNAAKKELLNTLDQGSISGTENMSRVTSMNQLPENLTNLLEGRPEDQMFTPSLQSVGSSQLQAATTEQQAFGNSMSRNRFITGKESKSKIYTGLSENSSGSYGRMSGDKFNRLALEGGSYMDSSGKLTTMPRTNTYIDQQGNRVESGIKGYGPDTGNRKVSRTQTVGPVDTAGNGPPSRIRDLNIDTSIGSGGSGQLNHYRSIAKPTNTQESANKTVSLVGGKEAGQAIMQYMVSGAKVVGETISTFMKGALDALSGKAGSKGGKSGTIGEDMDKVFNERYLPKITETITKSQMGSKKTESDLKELSNKVKSLELNNKKDTDSKQTSVQTDIKNVSMEAKTMANEAYRKAEQIRMLVESMSSNINIIDAKVNSINGAVERISSLKV